MKCGYIARLLRQIAYCGRIFQYANIARESAIF